MAALMRRVETIRRRRVAVLISETGYKFPLLIISIVCIIKSMTNTKQKGTNMNSLKKKADLVMKKYNQINCGDMRELLEAHGRSSELVRTAMMQRHYAGLSENDFLTILAFNAVLALEELQDVHLEQLRNGTFTPLNTQGVAK